MGREIRRVPPNWEHPKMEELGRRNQYRPLYDARFEDAAAEWKAEFAKWEAGEKLEHLKEDGKTFEFWEWHGNPPDPEYYRDYLDSDATWYQVYETVTEGTPVTLPFATLEELSNYLATKGDFWDQQRGDSPWGFKNADAFCRSGHAFSLVTVGDAALEPKEQAAYFEAGNPG